MQLTILNKLFIIFLFIFFTNISSGQAGIFDIKQAKLDNGLEINVIENHRAPIISFMIWYKVGGADDPKGKSGIAHFLEHLSFEGTDILKAGEYNKIIAENGGENNAFTGKDYTAYYENISKNKLDLVMFLAADRMKNVKINREVFIKEHKVVLEERLSRYDNDPVSLFNEKLNQVLWGDLPYSRPVIGFADELKNLNVKDVETFYNQFYAPNNAVIVVAGDTTLDKVVKYANEYFAEIPPSKNLPNRNWSKIKTKMPKQQKISMQDKRIKEARFMRIYAVPSFKQNEGKLAYSLEVLNEILGASLSSRLYKSLVMEQKKANSVVSFYTGDDFGQAEFGFYALPVQGVSLLEMERLIDIELNKIATGKISETELIEAKRKITYGLDYLKDNPNEIAKQVGELLSVGFVPEEMEAYPENIQAVSLSDIVKTAKYLTNKAPLVNGFLDPEKETDK